MSDPLLLIALLLLLAVANGAPVLATKLLKDRLRAPIDGGVVLADGRQVFGPSKTIRGLVSSLALTSLVGPLVGLDWIGGAAFAAASMAGDLAASFLKRRLGLPPHAQAVGLDQIPEALLPLALFKEPLNLTWLEVGGLVGSFGFLALVFSKILFRFGVRSHPY